MQGLDKLKFCCQLTNRCINVQKPELEGLHVSNHRPLQKENIKKQENWNDFYGIRLMSNVLIICSVPWDFQ